MMKRVLWMLSLVVTVAGCRAGASRGWQRSPMPSHDRGHVFEAAEETRRIGAREGR